MSGAYAGQGMNCLIETLPDPDRERILTDSTLVELTFGAALCEAGRAFDHVHFPLAGFVVPITRLHARQVLGVGLVGNEGMLGATLALGLHCSPMHGLVQSEGSAWRMTALQFQRALSDSPALRRTLHRYLYVLMVQLLRMNLCTHYHEIRPRLACWLLMAADRLHDGQLRMTHELHATMLGVRRSGVTVAARALQERDLIEYSHGRIRILDRSGLAAVSCECYEALLDDYSRFLF